MLDFVKSSKWMFLAATLFFAGGTFQVVDGHWIYAAICIGAAACFMSLGARYRKLEAGERPQSE